ncbi:MAG: hypothetical protein HY922_12420 [Elusimicrobia bacterium]|nr:hypothetical protein [Elusimicrobiota bacterium]
MERSSKKQAEAKAAAGEEKTVEQLILDRKHGKYGVVALISFWAKELRKLEENRHTTQAELLERAIREILSESVSLKEIEKRMIAGASNDGQDGAKSVFAAAAKKKEARSAES